MQGFVYLFYNWAHQNLKLLHFKYDRELFKLKDGGHLAIDWYDGKPHCNDGDNRPILVCFAGLGSST